MNFRVAFAVLTAGSLAYSLSADYVTLKQTDPDGANVDGVPVGFESSFLVNYDADGYGWSDGLDPSPDKDYRVSGVTLNTPCTGAANLREVVYTFPGKSLRVDGGGRIAFRSSWLSSANYATVRIDDLTLCKGSLTGRGWSRPMCWDGQITVDTSDYRYVPNIVKFEINMGTCHIQSKMIASDRENVELYGETKTYKYGGRYRWASSYGDYRYCFEGDCSGYFATNNCSWGAQAQVVTSDFGGSFNLGNAGSLKVAGGDSVNVRGNVISRDGTIYVLKESELNVQEGIDSAFADFSSHVSSGGTNVYTGLSSDEPYVRTNFVSAGSAESISVNYILVETNSTLSTPKMKLDGTLVKVLPGAVLKTGDAVFKDVILEIAAGGTLAITNSFTPTTPVKLRLTDMGVNLRTAFVTLPVGKGELSLDDFVFADGPQFRFVPSVETVDGIQTLWITDLNPNVKDETTGYVYQRNADGSSNSSFLIGSFNQAGNWSEEDQAPHSGTNYYSALYFRDKGSGPFTFQGDSLTLRSVFRIGARNFTINDFRVVPNEMTAIKVRTGITTEGLKDVFTFYGTMRVFTPRSFPFTFVGGLSYLNADGTVRSSQTYVVNMKVMGAADAAISVDGAPSRPPAQYEGQAACEFRGDMSEYYGTLFVGTNETVRLGSWGLTNGTLVVRTAYSTISTTADAGPFVPVKRYVTQTSSSLVVPAGTEFAVTECADITGTLTKTGEGVLSFGGEAVAGDGAELLVSEGGFKVKSADAVDGLPVVFGENAAFTVDAEAVGDLKAYGARSVTSETPFSATAEGAAVPVSFTGEIAEDELTVAVCTVSATASRPEFALPSKHHHHKIASSAWVENGDGTWTFKVSLVRLGMVIVVR